MLADKYDSINLAHGTPSMDAPDFLQENLKKATTTGFN
jgi:hypothetical protein